MKHYLLKLLIFLSPLLLIVGTYVSLDPFMVIWHYDNYYPADKVVSTNRGFVSTSVFKNQNDTCHYDSFIFGNSTSLSYHVDKWQQHIGTDTHCFHYDAMIGSVEGMNLKVKFVDEQGAKIKNALVILDHRMIGKPSFQSHLFMLPPALIHNQNLWKFHWVHFQSFLNPKFIRAYFDYRFTGNFKPYMEEVLNGKHEMDYNSITNEVKESYWERLIANGEYYTPEHCAVFKGQQHPDSTDIAHIDGERRKMLAEMASIFKRHNTRVKVVVSPFYDQIKLNPADLQCLQDIFGKENVYDFSGPNEWNCDYHNYYDLIHYRPHVATQILNIIYSESSEISENSENSEKPQNQL